MIWWKPLVAALACIGTLHAILHHYHDAIQFRLMRLFRDLGRYKALKRRLGNDEVEESKGLLAFLASDSDPLQDLLNLNAEAEDELHLLSYSRAELQLYGNHDSDDGSILLGILGRVYDVTEGDKFYGPTGTYGHFAGHDVTYALATGCKAMHCVETDWTQLQRQQSNHHDNGSEESAKKDAAAIFSDEQLLEAKKWLSFFHLHDKYPLVGKLEGDSFEELVQQLLAEAEQDDDDEDSKNTRQQSEQEMLDSVGKR